MQKEWECIVQWSQFHPIFSECLWQIRESLSSFPVLLSFLLIINARGLIEDLLSVRLSSLFTWETLWVPFAHYPCSLHTGRWHTDDYSPVSLSRKVPSVRWEKGWKRSLLFVQFTGVSFVLGLLLVTLLQYSLMSRDMGIVVPGLAQAQTWLPKRIGRAYQRRFEPPADGRRSDRCRKWGFGPVLDTRTDGK